MYSARKTPALTLGIDAGPSLWRSYPWNGQPLHLLRYYRVYLLSGTYSTYLTSRPTTGVRESLLRVPWW